MISGDLNRAKRVIARFVTSLGQRHSTLLEDGLGQAETGGHAGVDDLADLGVAGKRQEHEGVGGVERRFVGKPIAHHAGGLLRPAIW